MFQISWSGKIKNLSFLWAFPNHCIIKLSWTMFEAFWVSRSIWTQLTAKAATSCQHSISSDLNVADTRWNQEWTHIFEVIFNDPVHRIHSFFSEYRKVPLSLSGYHHWWRWSEAFKFLDVFEWFDDIFGASAERNKTIENIIFNLHFKTEEASTWMTWRW